MQSTSLIADHLFLCSTSSQTNAEKFYAQIFALSFHITYGTEIEEFANILSSWEHLFKMPLCRGVAKHGYRKSAASDLLVLHHLSHSRSADAQPVDCYRNSSLSSKIEHIRREMENLVSDLMLKSLVQNRRSRKMIKFKLMPQPEWEPSPGAK